MSARLSLIGVALGLALIIPNAGAVSSLGVLIPVLAVLLHRPTRHKGKRNAD